VFVIVFTGIIFDIIGIAVTAADETPFHAMASRKYYGAGQAIKLIRNANKVSSFCNDVVGDICGIISGAAGALIVVRVSQGLRAAEAILIGLSVSGMIASLTIGGKAIGKSIAIEKSNYITYNVSVVIQFLCRRKKFEVKNSRNKKRRK
jgi:CBS domain containing-hemolysin-like protein